VVQYRKSFVEKLLHSGEEEANEVRDEFKRRAETKREYESTAAALAKKGVVGCGGGTETPEVSCKAIPPRQVYGRSKTRDLPKLTQAINHAKETGDIDALRDW
jgi:hypothetical protein